MSTNRRKDYWIEAVTNALEECDLSATDEQIRSIADNIEISHKMY